MVHKELLSGGKKRGNRPPTAGFRKNSKETIAIKQKS